MATDRGESKPARWAALVLVVLFLALAVGLVARVLARDSGPEPLAGGDGFISTAARAAGLARSSADDLEPTLAVFPQRASIGRPLQLRATGAGCRAGGGVLSIYRLADADGAPAGSRLVVRQPVRVRTGGSWLATPLLAQPRAGSYRVAMTCNRVDQVDVALRVDGTGATDPVGRRDQLTISDVLVISAPATAGPAVDAVARRAEPAITVETTPTTAATGPSAGERRDVAVQGFGCDGRIEGRIVRSSDGTLLQTFRAFPDELGDWEVRVPLLLADALGAYRVEADCVAVGGSDSPGSGTTTSAVPRPGVTNPPPVPVTSDPDFNG